MQTKQEILQACTVKGRIVYLPRVQLERSLYQDVAKALNLIGGKWKGGKVMGFVFDSEPAELLAQISNGEKRNLKKEFQFFATPEHLANEMVQLAAIEDYDMILEPSAGPGAIIKSIQNNYTEQLVHYCELMQVNRVFLERLSNVQYITDNFLKLSQNKIMQGLFHKIIANPPFANNQDIDHIKVMYNVCAEGGRIVTIASNHWRHGSENKCKQFRQWLNAIDSEVQDIDAGEFKESGTAIATCIITINK
jgi:hypothetical protein